MIVKAVSERCGPSAEELVMAHRYLYYGLDNPVISDADYDALERCVAKVVPETSRVHQVGSSAEEDYTLEERALAVKLVAGTKPPG